MSKVFAVAYNSGFDYSISFVCPTKEAAETLAAKMNLTPSGLKDTYSIKEFWMVADPDEVQRRVRHLVWLDSAGGVIQATNDGDGNPGWASAEEPEIAEVQTRKTSKGDVQWIHAASYRSFDAALEAARALLAQITIEQAAP
jgi:hypothetical protein